MKQELQDKLRDEYIVFYPTVDPTKRYNEPFSDRGYEVADGWYDLIYELLSWIKFHFEKNNYPRITITQVKEKFGSLSFYYNTIPFEEVKWREWEEEKSHDEKLDIYLQGKYSIRGAVEFASSYTRNICEKCGSTMNVSRTTGKWIKYHCENCRIS